ncbi:MAG: DUF4388 domain-containing protein [Nitrospinae bacterium]|nr:DUF4388 domain-containing protein [Nitrospinota bacterium]
MALQGSLDDFNILNILQMIKLEGKTGRLTITEGEDLVKITFDNGAIIFAECAPGREEARIKGTLIGNRIVDLQAWNETKKEHEDSLKPYWELLAKRLPLPTLVELIKRQVLDNVYYALRWKKGTYEFTPMKGIKYNDKIMPPMDVDAVLMEGCRIADEWPRITAAIPPLGTYIMKNILAEDEYESLALKGPETGVDFQTSIEYEILMARGMRLSPSEVNVLSVIGHGMTIQTALDAARQGHFTSLEAIQSLFRTGILKAGAKKKDTTVAVDNTGNTARIATVGALGVILAAGLAWQIFSWPKFVEARKEGIIEVKSMQAAGQLNKIERALKIYTTLNGAPPQNLKALVEKGALEKSGLSDPWGNPYQYSLKNDRFILYSTGPDTFLGADNIYIPSQSSPRPAATAPDENT